MPQWTSETQLSYTSQYDFMCYDLEDDRSELVERPEPHEILCVRYAALIGQSLVRVIYLFRENKTLKVAIIPSYNMLDCYLVK